MTVKVAAVTFDCVDALVVGRFWSAALDRPLDPGGSSQYAAIGFAGRRTAAGWASSDRAADPTWLFVQVPEAKVAKNRTHLDVTAPDVEAEVARLVGLGATRVTDMEEYGYTWTVMTDPEGNEFCVAKETSP
jgi:predicted enzyme related to lactoylglutathione lyase